MVRYRSVLASAMALALGSILAFAPSVLADSHHNHGGSQESAHVVGTIQAFTLSSGSSIGSASGGSGAGKTGADTITIVEANGTSVTAAIEPTTMIEATAADFIGGFVGQTAVVTVSSPSGSQSPVATLIRVSGTQGSDHNSGKLQGTVQAAPTGTPGSFTVQDNSGATVTVNLTATTVIRLGDKTGSAQDIVQGAKVTVLGTLNTDGTFTATTVKVSTDGTEHKTNKLQGTVAAAPTSTPGSFIVQDKSGATVTVDLTATTVIRVGDQAGSAQDIAQGAKVTVTGTLNTDGSFSANTVKVSSDKNAHTSGKVQGTVESAPTGTPGSFTLQDKNGATITVDLTATTVIRVGDKTGSVQDIVQGAKVKVLGTLNTDGSFTADTIKVSTD